MQTLKRQSILAKPPNSSPVVRRGQYQTLGSIGLWRGGGPPILGIEQIYSENARAIEQWLDRLMERRFQTDEGILFVIGP